VLIPAGRVFHRVGLFQCVGWSIGVLIPAGGVFHRVGLFQCVGWSIGVLIPAGGVFHRVGLFQCVGWAIGVLVNKVNNRPKFFYFFVCWYFSINREKRHF